MDDQSHLGERIRRRRLALDLSQGELAKKVGVTERAVRNWEAATRRPWRRNRERLDEVLGWAQIGEGLPPGDPHRDHPDAEYGFDPEDDFRRHVHKLLGHLEAILISLYERRGPANLDID